MVSWVLLLAELCSEVEENSGFTVEMLNLIFFIFIYSFLFIHGCTFLAVVWWKIQLPNHVFTVLGKTRAKYLLSWNGPLAGETRRNGPSNNIISSGMLLVWGRSRCIPGETTTEWNLPALWEGIQRRGDNILLQVRIKDVLLWIFLCDIVQQGGLIKLVALLISGRLHHGRSLFNWQWPLLHSPDYCCMRKVAYGLWQRNGEGNEKDAKGTESHWLKELVLVWGLYLN